jgi:signal transduction histidine kinase
VVSRVLEELETPMLRKEVAVSMDTDLGRLRAEEGQIFRLFSNIISNAVRHGEAVAPEISIRHAVDRCGRHVYSVSDNGPGIPDEDLEIVFEPYVRGAGGGTGLGLDVARKIARTCGGDVSVTNDNGARFEIVLRDMA